MACYALLFSLGIRDPAMARRVAAALPRSTELSKKLSRPRRRRIAPTSPDLREFTVTRRFRPTPPLVGDLAGRVVVDDVVSLDRDDITGGPPEGQHPTELLS